MASERDDGLAALQRGDFPAAAALLEGAIQQDTTDFQAHLYLGGVYHQLQRYGDAARVLTRATELQPANAQARFNLGIAQEQSGDLKGAQASFEQAILLQADYPIAHEALERIQTRLQSVSELEASVPGAADASKPAYGRPVNSSFGSAPSSASSVPSSDSGAAPYTPTSSATPAYPPASGQPTQGAPPPYGASGYPPPEVAGRPTSVPPSPYGQPPYAQPYGQQPPVPYGQPAPPYGQPPYGAGYAPPGSYGYANAQQYVVMKQPVPQEATLALVLSIVGLPLTCTGLGIVLYPISLFLALRARKMLDADPSLGGRSNVTTALWLSAFGLGANILMWIFIIIAMFAGVSSS